jgi:hypothetical protein
MPVFLVQDKNVDSGVITGTGFNDPDYPYAGVNQELVVPNFWDSGNTRVKIYPIPMLSCEADGGSFSMRRCSDGGATYFKIELIEGSNYITNEPWQWSYGYTLYIEPRGWEEGGPVSGGPSHPDVMARLTTGITQNAFFSTGSITLLTDMDGEDLESWQISVRGRQSMNGTGSYTAPDTAPAGVMYPTAAPAAYILGDAFYPNLPVALGNGKVLVITVREDRDGDEAFHPEARVYTMTDNGWTRSTASDLPRQSYNAQAVCKTLDSSVLVQTDRTTAGAAAPGYYVATVNGDVVTGGALAAVTGTGPARSHSNSMVRLPNTNDFLAWRQHDDAVYVDLVRVSGTTCTVLDTATVAPPSGLTDPDLPRALVLDGATAALGALSYDTKVQFVRASVVGESITIDTDELTTTYTEGATLYPGSLDHTAEIMLRDGSAGSRVVKRLSVDYSGSAFSTEPMPIIQTTESSPPGYELRTEDGGIDPFTDAQYFPIAGDLYVARRLSDGPTDSNWIVVQQYDQATGTIKATEWSKGQMNGSGPELLSTTPLHMVYEPATKQLVVTASEQYFPNLEDAENFSLNARIATFRTTYVLAQGLRSQGSAFSG